VTTIFNATPWIILAVTTYRLGRSMYYTRMDKRTIRSSNR